MKTGLILTGSGKGAFYAGHLVDGLIKRGIPLDMVCAASIPAAALLLQGSCVAYSQIPKLLRREQQRPDPERLGTLLESGQDRGSSHLPLAVCTVDSALGTPVLFYDGLHSDAWNWKILSLKGNEKVAFQSSCAPALGYPPAVLGKLKLWDFTVKYGLPVQLPRMAGVKRVAAIHFSGGEAPAQMAADSLVQRTAHLCDLFFCMDVPLNPISRRIDGFLDEITPILLEKLLF